MDRQKLGTFVLGGVAGAVAGILIAPRSGRELRGAISSRAGEARQRGREGYFEARERASERVAGMREPSPERPERDDAPEMTLGREPQPTAGPAPDDILQDTPQPPREEPGHAPLRAVPPEAEPARPAAEDQDELRRRIRATRDRLRGRRPEGGSDGNGRG